MSTAARVLAGTARWACERGHCAALLGALPAGCVHCCVTSPPYYGLRAYLDDGHPDKALEIGTEETPEEYVERTVCAFREVRRVLHPSGNLWLNLGDSYVAHAMNGGTGSKENGKRADRMIDGQDKRRLVGVKPKDLIGIPWMVAFALRADGWYLRQWCPWAKRNPMPESVEDRPGTGCETVFLLSKESGYFFDMEAVRKPLSEVSREFIANAEENEPSTELRGKATIPGQRVHGGGLAKRGRAASGAMMNPDGRNFRSSDLWFDSVGMLLAGEAGDPELLGFDVTLRSYKGAHFAVMPKRLVEPCVLAGTSAKGVCPACGEPWVRVVEKERRPTRPGTGSKVRKMYGGLVQTDQPGIRHSTLSGVTGNRDPERHCTTTQTTGWRAGCSCAAGEPVPAVVLDPFAGSGTVLSVAVEHGRRALGCELNADYLPLVERRMRNVTPRLFSEE